MDTSHRATDPLCSPAGGVGQVDVVEDQPRDARVASRTLGAQLPVHLSTAPAILRLPQPSTPTRSFTLLSSFAAKLPFLHYAA